MIQKLHWLVYVENTGFGSTYAAPAATLLIEKYLKGEISNKWLEDYILKEPEKELQRRINIWKNLDWVTVMIYLVMILFGWINIYAAVYNEEHASIFDLSQRYGKQLLFIIAAIVLAVMVMVIDSRFYLFFSYVIYGLVIILSCSCTGDG